MARSFTPQDACALVTQLVKEATGADAGTTIDSSNFVSAGEKVLATGYENVLNSLSVVLGRTFMAVRPREARFKIVQALDNNLYSNRMRKISFYARDPKHSGWFNTDLYTNLKDGYDNGSNGGQSTASMWEQNQAVPLEMNFAGSSTWQDSNTTYKNQLRLAFRSPEDMAGFINGILMEKRNDISRQKESWNRMNVLNKIAGTIDIGAASPKSVVNLTAEFNAKYGTSYTSEQLRTTYLKEFLAFFVETFKLASEMLTYDTVNYHWTPAKTVDGEALSLIRHTPYSKQRVMLYEPLFVSARANVMPDIFNPDYLDIGTQYEGVMFWQSPELGAEISVEPAIPDTANGGAQVKGAKVEEYIVGMIYDDDGLMTSFQFDGAEVTPLEARKGYYTTWYTFARNAINDATENCIVFIMKDED